MTKPMLATDVQLPLLRYPLYASPKLDGLRCMIINGQARTRSLKLFPNHHVNTVLNHPLLDGLDGELIVGEPTAKDVIQQCTSNLMSKGKVFKFSFHVFDRHDMEDYGFDIRYKAIQDIEQGMLPHMVKHRILSEHCSIHLLEQDLIYNEVELLDYEARMLELGYEGLIVRAPQGLYKYGRSTVKEGYLLKLKRFLDSEAEIIGFEEQMFNGNEAMVNELGRTKRSSAKAGKTGKDTLGALIVRDLKTGVQFNVGTGMDDELRKKIWDDRTKYLSLIIRYKYFPVGVKDAPRHPVFLTFRDSRDMST